jgi:membrane-associated phospholipid phosphatase
MTAAVGGQFVISNVVKLVVRRKRPDVLPLAGSSGSSFPSRHSMASAASYGAVAVLLTRGRSPTARLAGAVAAGGTALAVGSTRVVLGVHWTSDVLAGLALGWGWLTATYLVARERWLRRAA